LLYWQGHEVLYTATDSLQFDSPRCVGRQRSEVRNAIYDWSEDRVASLDSEGVIRIWSRADGSRFELVFDRYVDGQAEALRAFDRTGRYLVYLRNNRSRIDVLDLAHPDALPLRLLPEQNFVHNASFTPDGNWLTSGWFDDRLGGGHEVYFYEMTHPRPRAFRCLPEEDHVSPNFFLPDGETLVARSRGKEIQLATVKTTEPTIRSLWNNPFGRFECAVAGPDGRHICVNNKRRQRVLLIPLDGSEPTELGRPEGIIFGMAIEPGGRRVAFSGGQLHPVGMPDRPIIYIHDIASGEQDTLVAEGECGFYGVEFLPGNRLCSYSHEGLLIWDLESGEHERISTRPYKAVPPDRKSVV